MMAMIQFVFNVFWTFFVGIPFAVWRRYIDLCKRYRLFRNFSYCIIFILVFGVFVLGLIKKGMLGTLAMQDDVARLFTGANRAIFDTNQDSHAGRLLQAVAMVLLGPTIFFSWIYIPLILLIDERGNMAARLKSILQPNWLWKRRIKKWERAGCGAVLGTINKRPFLFSNELRAEHTLVLGSTGTGKTTSLLEPSIKSDIEAGHGLVFVTGKEEPDFIERTIAYAVEAGRRKDLRLFMLSDTLPSHSLNPLIHGDETALRDLCFGAFTWDSPYYRDQAKSALLHVFAALVRSGTSFSLEDLYYLFNERSCMEMLAERTADPKIQHHLNTYVADWKTFHDNMRGLIANLEDYTTEKLTSRVCPAKPDINFIEAHRSKQIVIIVLNSLQYGETARRLGRMILQNVRFLAGKVAEEGGKSFFPIYIDEFHHFVYPEFFSMVAQCRSANIGLTLCTQSFADMIGTDFDITTQVVQNTNTKIIFRQNDAKSAEMVSKLGGTQTVMLHTQQTESHWLMGRMITGLGSVRPEEEFIIHPNLIRTLQTGQAALIVRGRAAVLQAMRPLPPKGFYEYTKIRTTDIEDNRYAPPLNIYGLWREQEEKQKGEGIRPPRVTTPPVKQSGLQAIKLKAQKLNA